jgi:hypothetical protein
MANLLPRKTPARPFPRLDPEQCQRLADRLGNLAAVLDLPDGLTRLARRFSAFEGALEELESGASLVTAHDLLDGFDRVRGEIGAQGDVNDEPAASVGASHPADSSVEPGASRQMGEWLCYWPGRSLSTGESEVASRGFFDVMDRPPLAYWLEAIARPTAASHEAFEVAILVWVPAAEFARVQAGRRACDNGSLALLREVSADLVAQIGPMLATSSRSYASS